MEIGFHEINNLLNELIVLCTVKPKAYNSKP